MKADLEKEMLKYYSNLNLENKIKEQNKLTEETMIKCFEALKINETAKILSNIIIKFLDEQPFIQDSSDISSLLVVQKWFLDKNIDIAFLFGRFTDTVIPLSLKINWEKIGSKVNITVEEWKEKERLKLFDEQIQKIVADAIDDKKELVKTADIKNYCLKYSIIWTGNLDMFTASVNKCLMDTGYVRKIFDENINRITEKAIKDGVELLGVSDIKSYCLDLHIPYVRYADVYVIAVNKLLRNRFGKITIREPAHRSLTKQLKIELYKKYNYACAVCGKKEDLHIHHKNKNSNDDGIANLILLCYTCHTKIHRVLNR